MYRVLLDLDLPNLEPADNLHAVQDLWLNGKMTNFDYLMHLNRLAGRSFNDLMQYPIFPFVLSQYDQNSLDLSNSSCYRFSECSVCYVAVEYTSVLTVAVAYDIAVCLKADLHSCT